MNDEEDIKIKSVSPKEGEMALDNSDTDMDNVSRTSMGGAPSDSVDSDVHYESEEENEAPALVIKKLREKNRLCEKEKKEYLDGWQRMRADFANARKDEESRRGELIKFASEGLIEDLLPVLDSFTSAFANKEAWEKVDANWRKGVEYIYAQMYSVLESRGLGHIGAVGEKLDPRIHIVVEEVVTEDGAQADTIADVIQKGYRFHSKVIRPASVKVFGLKPDDPDSTGR